MTPLSVFIDTAQINRLPELAVPDREGDVVLALAELAEPESIGEPEIATLNYYGAIKMTFTVGMGKSGKGTTILPIPGSDSLPM